QPEFSVVVAVGTVQAGDQISRIRLYAEQFVTGPQGYLLGVVDERLPLITDRIAYAAERSLPWPRFRRCCGLTQAPSTARRRTPCRAVARCSPTRRQRPTPTRAERRDCGRSACGRRR